MLTMRFVRSDLRVAMLAAILVGAPLWLAMADDKKDSGGSLGDLFKKVKDIKVPDSVATLPGQLTELKDAYLKTAQTVEELSIKVDQLNDEVAALKADNEQLHKALEDKRVRDDLTEASEVTSAELIEAYDGDTGAADAVWKGRYLKVSGPIERFESGNQEDFVYLRGIASGTLIRCAVKRNISNDIDVIPTQGRMVRREDRSTLLTVGQPVTITGTCVGAELNVILENCRIDGFDSKAKDTK